MNCANHPERERTAFCQNCGKALCPECTRIVGTAVFCEPCLASKLSGAPPSAGAGPSASANFGNSYAYPDLNGSYPPPPSGAVPPSPGSSNPGLAALLGFIPGVGAMYNQQYAKGIVHLIIFAVLVSLTDHHDVFGLFVAGWIFYQVFDAYQTAVARRDGLPLPNPFGFNDIGERLGFGKSWGAGSSTPYTAPVAAYAPPPADPNTPPVVGVPPQQPWETPWANYVPPASNPYVSTPPAFDPNSAPPFVPRNRFPVGAMWLIGLGIFFLVGNSGIFRVLPMQILFPSFLIGLGVWIFYNRMTATGPLGDDGTPYYRMRLASAMRGSVWIILVGIMFLLSNLHILSWGHSWPLFIIVAGVLILVERTAFASSSAPAYYPPPPYQAPPAASSSTTSVVPPAQQDETPNPFNQEGR
ncbi:B-box zinc finger protein [Edaphobacter flagellatus]|uniref:B-box zinc finger protein n=1 Tax=Edaphobacter flagellatus TaxID=1933044 RepID=UPI0021B441FE|nr:B-box zinc finger protein [Edaphobacter flagellatus]